VGTAGGLVAYRPDGTWQLDPTPGDVRGLCGGGPAQQEPGTLYLLAWPDGFARRAGAGPLQFYAPQPDGIPLALALGREGSPHALTTRGLWRLGPGRPERVVDGSDAAGCRLAQSPDGAWWLGTPHGLLRAGPGGRWEPVGEQGGPPPAEVTDLGVIGGTLWVATTAGLWARGSSVWQRHLAEGAAGDAVFRAVAAADPGSLWLALEDRIVRYEPAGRGVLAEHLPGDSGLGSVRVRALRQGAGALWVVTECGVSRLTLQER
jgi:ligand-binding sensor domain-containing protein